MFVFLEPQKQLKRRVDIDLNYKRLNKDLMFTSREYHVNCLDSTSEISFQKTQSFLTLM